MIPIEVLASSPERFKDDSGNWLPSERIAVLLCSPYQVPNPVPQGTVSKPINLDDAITAMSPASLARLAGTALASDFISAVKTGDTAAAERLIKLGVKAGIVSKEEAMALLALDGQIPDPNWQATVTLPAVCASCSAAEVDIAIAQIGGDL